MKKLVKSVVFVCLLINGIAFAATVFTVQKIQVTGLQRVSNDTLMSYLPLKVGQRLEVPRQSTTIIADLYKTGFFSNIQLDRSGNTLIIKVTERPTISYINITGNKEIPQDKLKDVLSKLGLVKGRFLDHATLQQINQALENQYFATGRYNVKINVKQTVESRNRVAVHIKISEGAIAKIGGITITGNNNIPSALLDKQLTLATPTLTSFFTRKDEYSEQKLQSSQEGLQNYYMDHGYINVKLDSTNVGITPDRKQVYLNFQLTEGEQFHFSGYKLSGQLLDKTKELNQAIQINKGDVFSRQSVMDANQGMSTILGNDGYAFAKIQPEPQIDKKNKTVFINFVVTPGRKYYIRRINFMGNASTSEIALRKQLYQMEGGLYSTSKIHYSVFRLRQNSYLQPAQPPQIIPTAVPGKNNLLDLNVTVAEKLSAELQLSIGYSQAYGFLLSTGITQSNFMGTGKTVGFSINTSSYQKSFSVSYTNPYYTPDGVSRSISVFGTQTNSDQLNIAQYSTDSYGANVSYGFPMSVYSSLNLGYGFTDTHLKIPVDSSCTKAKAANDQCSVYQNFQNNYGNRFKQLLLTVGWSRNTTDNSMLPNRGTSQSLNLTISAPVTNKQALQYFKLSYTNDWYQPLNKYFTLRTHGTVGYGDGYGFMKSLPFFQNYYAGGLGVQGLNRAYSPFSLGPVDPVSRQQVGGNLLISGLVSIILPNFFHSNSIRTSIFMDGGNVFNTHSSVGPYDFKPENLRYSYGAQLEWWTPLNLPLIFSIAQPMNNQPKDQTDPFQFTIGTMF